MPILLGSFIPIVFLLLGILGGFVHPLGTLFGMLMIGWVLAGYGRLPGWLWWWGSLICCAALAAHLLPGYTPWQAWAPRYVSSDGPLFSLYLSWDKALVAITLAVWWWHQPRPAPWLNTDKVLVVSVATVALVPLLALSMGLVTLRLKWPEQIWLWLLINFGVSVLAEELLFRAWLQRSLVLRFGTVSGVGASAVLFGLTHLPLGWSFALIATLAGLGYGLAFLISGRLRTALALHAAVNLIHLLCLSYPLRLA